MFVLYAAGELLTPAKWIRNFISQHSDYKKDSIITEKITYDLMVACDKISKANMCVDLTGTLNSRPTTNMKSCPKC